MTTKRKTNPTPKANAAPAKKRGRPRKADAGSGITASSLTHASGLTGYPVDVFKKAKEAGCAAIDSRNRVNLDKFKEWLRGNEQVLDVDEDAISKEQAEIKRILKQCRKLDLEYDVARGKFVTVDAVNALCAELWAAQLAILRPRLEREYPKLVAGLPTPAIRVKGKQIVDDIIEDWRRIIVEKWKLKATA